jgi:RHS repeat-associated protein
MRLYVTQDANFNVTALVDTSGTVQERFTYEPYGNANILDQDWNGTSDAYDWTYFHQCGAFDLDTVIYAFRNRDYHPSLGRWMERDLFGYAGGLNLYNYENNNPVGQTDPEGLLPSCFGNPVHYIYKHPPFPWQPLPSSSPECDKYNPHDTYDGANAQCFCKNAPNDPWSQFVRGCLRTMYSTGVPPETAHLQCYWLADTYSGASPPWGKLLSTFYKCFTF